MGIRGEGGEEFEGEADFLGEAGVGGVVLGEVEQALDRCGLDVGGDVGQAFGADAADAFQGQRELGVFGGRFEGFEGDLVGAAEGEFVHAWFVPVVEEGVDEVERDFGVDVGGGRVHGGKVRRAWQGSR